MYLANRAACRLQQVIPTRCAAALHRRKQHAPRRRLNCARQPGVSAAEPRTAERFVAAAADCDDAPFDRCCVAPRLRSASAEALPGCCGGLLRLPHPQARLRQGAAQRFRPFLPLRLARLSPPGPFSVWLTSALRTAPYWRLREPAGSRGSGGLSEPRCPAARRRCCAGRRPTAPWESSSTSRGLWQARHGSQARPACGLVLLPLADRQS